MPDASRRTLLVVCPTDRDDEYLAHRRIVARCAVEAVGSLSEVMRLEFDEGAFFDQAAERLSGRDDLDGIIGTDDFPASFLAALLGERLRLHAPPVVGVFLAQHKWYSRLAQARVAPDATPRCELLDLAAPPHQIALPFPFFAKPVKSFASVLSRRIDTPADLDRLIADARDQLPAIARGFDPLVARSALPAQFRTVSSQALILEELIGGVQVTLDGFVAAGEVHVLGIVDSHFVPGTRSFQRFEAPSALPWPVQQRMADVARRVVLALGLDRVVFNVELCFDAETDAIRVIEVNGRMASQFVPLYRRLFDVDPYEIQVALALGEKPRVPETFLPPDEIVRAHGVAASFVLRARSDALVRRVPSRSEIAALKSRFPGARVELLVAEGDRLSDHFQDGETFRYALIDLGADSREELHRVYAEARAMVSFRFEPTSMEDP